MTAAPSWKSGGCHCGAVAFEVYADDDAELSDCNCSICAMTGYLHLIVPKEHFRLVRGQDSISTYTFNTGTAKHTFCKICGIKSFYTPRSHPDGVSVNARCLSPDAIKNMRIVPFDGRHWEQHAAELPPLEGAA